MKLLRKLRKNKNMQDKSIVFLNITPRKFMCIDFNATLEYDFIEVGSTYNEAVFDIQLNKNRIPDHCILLLVHGEPFYVKKEYICRVEEESDMFREIISESLIFSN